MQNNKLTARESEAMNLLSEGLLYKEVADRMNVTLGNVKQKAHKIYEKLDVSNRTEAINKLKGTNKS